MGFLDSIAGGITGLFEPERPYEAAQEEAEKGWNESKGYVEPFYNRGKDEYSRLNDFINALRNPEQLQNQWASGYETSPYAQRLLNMNRESGLNAASSMGLMGSSAALRNIQQGAGDIVARDRRDYLNDLMQKYLQAIGLSQGVYNQGANAADTLLRSRMEHGTNLAGLAYGREAAPTQMIMNMLRLAANAYSGGGMGTSSGV